MTTRKRQLPSFARAVCSSNHRQAAKVHTSDEALDDRTLETIARLRSAFVPPCVPSVPSCSRAPFCDAGFGRFCGPPSPASCYIRSKLGRVHSARNKRSATSKATMSLESGAPPMVARATSAPSAKTIRRLRSYSCVEARRTGAAARLSVFARLPASCPFVGSFHYAPSAGNRAYCFFEGQIVPHRETRRLHKIKTNPLTGNFHSRPGHYSRLHGLQNFRSEFEGLSAADDGGMTAIIARIKTSLTEPSRPAKAQAAANDDASDSSQDLHSSGPNSNSSSTSSSAPVPIPTRRKDFDSRPQLGPRAHTLQGFHSRHSACDARDSAAALLPAGSGKVYRKFWEKVDTERGRFGSSVDDNALGTSSLSSLQQSAAAAETAADGRMVKAAKAAGLSGIGKGGVHWGEHHHHHNLHHEHQRSPSSDDGERAREALVGNAAAKNRHAYLEKKQRERPVAVMTAQRARSQANVAVRGGGSGGGAAGAVPTAHVNASANAGRGSAGRGFAGRGLAGRGCGAGRGTAGHGSVGRGFTRRGSASRGFMAHGGRDINGSLLTSRRSMPDAWAAAAAAVEPSNGIMGGGGGGVGASGGGAGASSGGRMRRATYTGQGWESHTVQAQQKTEEYMQGREDLAPDMRPDVVLDNEVSLAYDVDVSDAGMLGAGAYGTVLAAVHRSTGRQVAIKTMLKKYLFSDAEKASVEREIEIQQRLVNNHVVRLYEIYQSPEKLYLVVERAPCGTLEEFLYVRGRMNELDAKRVVRQLLDGLAYLHKVGVVHCDLKPANILFSDIDQGATATAAADVASGGAGGSAQLATPRAKVTAPPTSLSGLVVKICDFGHARKVPDCRYYKFTRDINKIPFHMFKHTGTEGFVAPEVLRSEPYGKAADTWSTGCMLYQMLTGRMPWMPSRACLQRPLSTSGPSWRNISELAKSLVGDLLTADQSLRADVEQATHHPWFEGIHHCARMPTSAPGGKVSANMSPRPTKLGSMSAITGPPLPKLPTLAALSLDEGVRSGDVAAGGGGGRAGRGGRG